MVNNATRTRLTRTLILCGAITGLAAGYFIGATQREADAGPPEPSNGGGSTRSSAEAPGSPSAALDPALQRVELAGEMRALRAEVASLRDTLTSGKTKVQVTNLKELDIGKAVQAAMQSSRTP